MPCQRDSKPLPLPRLLVAAALYAAAEIAAAILIGGFFEWGRAEPLLFVAIRPWLLLLLSALAAGCRLGSRAALYLLALLLASLSEVLLVYALGAAKPWPQTLMGFAASALLLVPIDLAVQLGRRLHTPWGRPAAAAALAILFLTPFGLVPYEALVLQRGPGPTGERPGLMLMTALPIIWGEGGAFDPESRPAESYRLLEREFAVRPLDVIDAPSLAGGRLLLLAQPRVLAPRELVALDAWVRRGGRALILSDPLLLWPSELPLGDVRRPPAVGLLAPLLTHWGIDMEPAKRELKLVHRRHGAVVRRIALAAPGAIVSANGACRVEPERYFARCGIGKGSVILLADADLLHDSLWAPAGAERHQRASDNPQAVADLLDELAGVSRGRADADVEWAERGASRSIALAWAALPLAAALGLAGLFRLRRRSD